VGAGFDLPGRFLNSSVNACGVFDSLMGGPGEPGDVLAGCGLEPFRPDPVHYFGGIDTGIFVDIVPGPL
jgi:hypothetical protein